MGATRSGACSCLYVTDGAGVLESLDDGRTWADISVGLVGEIICLTADLQRPGMVYAGTDAGIFSIRRPITTSAAEGEVTPLHTIVLHPSCPNPFNACTTIGFTLPEESEVELTVYNLLAASDLARCDGASTGSASRWRGG